MKIFISHSSNDKWIARRLSEDLTALGAETFLDEKDIQTGDSIDDSIQQHLKDSDEIVMLISPTALKSHWVLMEIGGAKALGMRLVPVLLHVGPNDLPSPLSQGLCRDLNEIQKYYDEVKGRMEGSATEEKVVTRRAERTEDRAAVEAAQRRRTFRVGDLVRIPEQPQSTYTDGTGSVSWNEQMTAHAGKKAIVTELRPRNCVALDVDGGDWWWVRDWLEPAND